MLKTVGAALVMVSCAGLGFRIARDFRERPRQLIALMHAVRLLQSEIEYSVTPLPAALRRVAARSVSPIRVLFETAAEQLSVDGSTAMEAFAVGIDRCRLATALRTVDLEVIAEFSNTLGRWDRVHQSQEIEVALSRLGALEQEAQEARRKNERLWQYLGILTGVLLVILLS